MQGRFLRQTLRLLLDWPCALPVQLRHPYGELRGLLAELYKKKPGLLLGILSLPSISGPIQAALLAPDEGRGLMEVVPHLLLALARAKVLGQRGFWWPVPIHRLLDPTLKLHRAFRPPAVGALFSDGEVDLGEGGLLKLEQAQTPAYFPLQHGGWLATVDTNPLAMVEAHPDKAGNAVDLGSQSAEAWVDVLNQARALIAEMLPELAAEHARVLAMVIPVGCHGQKSLSASYREVIGQVYLSYLPDPLAIAEALIHETQHNKLNLLSLHDPLLRDHGQALYHSPVRPDPRPLWGLLLAVHAFLPVAEFYHQLLIQQHPTTQNDRFLSRFHEILHGNHEGMEALRQHAQPTPLGKTLLDGLDHLERQQYGYLP